MAWAAVSERTRPLDQALTARRTCPGVSGAGSTSSSRRRTPTSRSIVCSADLYPNAGATQSSRTRLSGVSDPGAPEAAGSHGAPLVELRGHRAVGRRLRVIDDEIGDPTELEEPADLHAGLDHAQLAILLIELNVRGQDCTQSG
jgi:hypothetical protein